MPVPNRDFIRKLTAAVALGSLVLAGTAASLAAADAPRDPHADRMQERQARMAGRLDEMANRLEIKASQQDAWQTYVKSVKSLADHPAPPALEGADAATLTRARAAALGDTAKKLDQLADATAKLQAVLSPGQRATLDQIVRQAGRHGWMGGHDGRFGEHGGHEHGGMGMEGHCDMHDGHGGPGGAEGGPEHHH